MAAGPPHHNPTSWTHSQPCASRDKWKDRWTDTPRHSTCITYCPRWVPLVDGVLEVGPQLVKGYDLGEGRVPVRGRAATDGLPYPSSLGLEFVHGDQAR